MTVLPIWTWTFNQPASDTHFGFGVICFPLALTKKRLHIATELSSHSAAQISQDQLAGREQNSIGAITHESWDTPEATLRYCSTTQHSAHRPDKLGSPPRIGLLFQPRDVQLATTGPDRTGTHIVLPGCFSFIVRPNPFR